MNKEIGGYFGLEQTIKKGNGEYYPTLIALNTSRNALVYVLKARNVKKLYIPYYLCDSISSVCDREGYSYDYYHIGTDFLPNFDKQLDYDEYLYVVNYFGQLDNKTIIELKDKYRNIIVDNVQAFFQKPIDGIDTIYSCRKWFGVPDGAYLSTDCFFEEELEIDNSENRTKHLIGRIRDGAAAHYNEFKENDSSFKTLKLMDMSDLTHRLLNDIDYERIIDIRNNNFHYLHGKLRTINAIDVKILHAPFCYPLLIKNGFQIKKILAKYGIYIPTLWHNVVDCIGIEGEYAKNILPIPVDQRYEKSDIFYLVETIKQLICSGRKE